MPSIGRIVRYGWSWFDLRSAPAGFKPGGKFSREAWVWLVAALLSLVLHLMLFGWQPTPIVSLPHQKEAPVTHLTFRKLASPRPRVVQKLPAVSVPKPTPPRYQLPAPQKIKPPQKPSRPEVSAEVLPPVEQSGITPPVQPAPVQPAPVQTLPEIAKPEPISPAAAEAATETATAPVNSMVRRRYLEELFARIESHKEYPALARRRRLEGEVLVSLRIESDGSLAELSIAGGVPRLREAARKAVERSLPLPPPPDPGELPLSFSFTMDFRLR